MALVQNHLSAVGQASHFQHLFMLPRYVHRAEMICKLQRAVFVAVHDSSCVICISTGETTASNSGPTERAGFTTFPTPQEDTLFGELITAVRRTRKFSEPSHSVSPIKIDDARWCGSTTVPHESHFSASRSTTDPDPMRSALHNIALG